MIRAIREACTIRLLNLNMGQIIAAVRRILRYIVRSPVTNMELLKVWLEMVIKTIMTYTLPVVKEIKYRNTAKLTIISTMFMYARRAFPSSLRLLMKKEKERALHRSPTVLMIIVVAKNASSDFDMAQESKFLNALVLFLPIQELLNKVKEV